MQDKRTPVPNSRQVGSGRKNRAKLSIVQPDPATRFKPQSPDSFSSPNNIPSWSQPKEIRDKYTLNTEDSDRITINFMPSSVFYQFESLAEQGGWKNDTCFLHFCTNNGLAILMNHSALVEYCSYVKKFNRLPLSDSIIMEKARNTIKEQLRLRSANVPLSKVSSNKKIRVTKQLKNTIFHFSHLTGISASDFTLACICTFLSRQSDLDNRYQREMVNAVETLFFELELKTVQVEAAMKHVRSCGEKLDNVAYSPSIAEMLLGEDEDGIEYDISDLMDKEEDV